MHLCQLQIIDIIAKVIGHSSNHARFTSPGRAVEKVTPLPSPPSLMVERLSIGEVLEILHDLSLLLRVHGQCVKGAGVLEGHRFPGVAPGIQGTASGIGVQKTILVLPPDIAGFLHNVIEVGIEDQGLVFLLDPEREATLLVGERTPGEGLGLPLRDHVLPEDVDAVEGVHDAVIVGEPEGEAAGVDSACETEAVSGDGNGGAEVELHGVVELVGVDAVDLRYVEVAVGGEAVEDPVEELDGSETELRWEDCLEDGLTEGKDTEK